MLGNYQNLQMDNIMFQNFTSLLFPPPQYSPLQHSIFPVNHSSSMGDFSMLKLNSNLVDSPPALTRTVSTTPQTHFQPPALSIPDMVANTSGFNFLPQYFAQPSPTNFGAFLNLPGFWSNPTTMPQTFMDATSASMPQQIPPRLRPVDMPVLSPLLPGISSSFSSFATLPLVPISTSPKNIESRDLPIELPPTLYPSSSPSFFENHRIPQDPTTSQPTFDEMPSLSTSNPFEISAFHSIFDMSEQNKNEETYSISNPSSPPILTLIDDPIHSDDPNPPTLKPEVEMEQDEVDDKHGKADFDHIPQEPPKLDQEEIIPLGEESITNLENSIFYPNSSTSTEASFLNNTETSNADSSTESRLILEEEPILDSVEAIRQFKDELNLSEADWVEIMTESRRKRLRPSTQANTVATLTKNLNNQQNHKNVKNGRKTRSSGSSERENHVKFHENESENQAPSSTTERYSSPISIDVDFCKETFENSTPSSSGISSSSNLSEQSSKNQSKWKILRRSKNGNTLWLGSSQDDNNNNEEQKENVFLSRIPKEVPTQIQKGTKRRHSLGCRKVKHPKRIKSNWQPIGKPVEKIVRLCNDAAPALQECYTAIKHRYETDEIIRVRDCIKVRSAEGLENVGKVMNFYFDESSGYLMASVLWYYTREQIDGNKNPLLIPLHEKELLASRHIDNIACDAIESIAFVLTFNEYCRYITEGQIDSLPACLRPLESQEIWPRGEENYPRRSRLPHEDSPFEVVYFSRRVYDVKMKRVYVPKLSSSLFLRPTRTTLNRPIRASSH